MLYDRPGVLLAAPPSIIILNTMHDHLAGHLTMTSLAAERSANRIIIVLRAIDHVM
jgi:hypothetical protein